MEMSEAADEGCIKYGGGEPEYGEAEASEDEDNLDPFGDDDGGEGVERGSGAWDDSLESHNVMDDLCKQAQSLEASREREMVELCRQLDPHGDEQRQSDMCGKLEQLLREHGQLKHALILHHQVTPLVEMLDSKMPVIIHKALRVVHEAMTERHCQEGKHAGGDYTGVIGMIGAVVDNMLTGISPYVSMRQHASACVSMRQHTSAYVSICQHTSAYVDGARW
jgi:hypothetical protein